MNYAIVNNENIVENVVLAEPDFAAEQGWVEIPEEQKAGIGWVYDGKIFIEPTIDEEEDQRVGWEAIRSKRNELLKETDVFMLVDRFDLLTLQEQNSMVEYRQELRDMPQSYSNYLEVIWPERPSFFIDSDLISNSTL